MTMALLHTAEATTQTSPASIAMACGRMVDVSSNTKTTRAFWEEECVKLNNSTTMIRIDMGSVTDYFKPNPGKSWCEMLTSSSEHQWSSDGQDWITPLYFSSMAEVTGFGGSDRFVPQDYIPGDRRAYLSFWGGEFTSVRGGCCTSSYEEHSLKEASYGQAFTMYACGPDPSTTNTNMTTTMTTTKTTTTTTTTTTTFTLTTTMTTTTATTTTTTTTTLGQEISLAQVSTAAARWGGSINQTALVFVVVLGVSGLVVLWCAIKTKVWSEQPDMTPTRAEPDARQLPADHAFSTNMMPQRDLEADVLEEGRADMGSAGPGLTE